MLRYVNAGHTPPVVLRRNGSIDTLGTDGAPVGMFPDSSYEEGVQGLLKATAAWARQGTENAEHLVRSIFNSMDDFSKGARRMMQH